MNPVLLVLTVLAMIGGGFSKGALGFGFPLIVTPLVAILLDPQTAVVSISVPALFSNFLILVRGGMNRADFLRFAPALLLIVIGTFLGANLLLALPAATLSLLVGVMTVFYCITALTGFHPNVSPRLEKFLTPLVGALGGLMGGATNISGPVFGIYLHNLRLEKRVYVYTISTLFITSNLTQVLSYAQLNLFTELRIWVAIGSCIPMMMGLYLGMWAQTKINQALFSRLVIGLLFVTGSSLIWRYFTQ